MIILYVEFLNNFVSLLYVQFFHTYGKCCSRSKEVKKLRHSCEVIYFILLPTSLCNFQVCLYFIYWEEKDVMCGSQLHQYNQNILAYVGMCNADEHGIFILLCTFVLYVCIYAEGIFQMCIRSFIQSDRFCVTNLVTIIELEY